LTCFSEKTFEVFRNAFKEKLGVDFKKPQFLKKRNERREDEEIRRWKERDGGRSVYEPSNIWNTVSLRLGEESGVEGWYRVWQWWKQGQEIGAVSMRRFSEIVG
jgi:hypothetical protein